MRGKKVVTLGVYVSDALRHKLSQRYGKVEIINFLWNKWPDRSLEEMMVYALGQIYTRGEPVDVVVIPRNYALVVCLCFSMCKPPRYLPEVLVAEYRGALPEIASLDVNAILAASEPYPLNLENPAQ